MRQQPKLIGVKKKLDRREAVRERKALSAAHLERSIEKELIERLQSKAYGDGPLNVNETVWQAILDREHDGSVVGQREDKDLDLITDETDEEIIEMEDELHDREFVSDISGDDLTDLEGALDHDSDGGYANDDEGEWEANQLKSSYGKRKASSFTSLPIQRPEKKAKST